MSGHSLSHSPSFFRPYFETKTHFYAHVSLWHTHILQTLNRPLSLPLNMQHSISLFQNKTISLSHTLSRLSGNFPRRRRRRRRCDVVRRVQMDIQTTTGSTFCRQNLFWGVARLRVPMCPILHSVIVIVRRKLAHVITVIVKSKSLTRGR